MTPTMQTQSNDTDSRSRSGFSFSRPQWLGWYLLFALFFLALVAAMTLSYSHLLPQVKDAPQQVRADQRYEAALVAAEGWI